MLYPIEIKTSENLISEEDFLKLCLHNKEINFERNADKTILLMTPGSMEKGRINANFSFQLVNWENENSTLGYTFGARAGFTLPNGAVRSPSLSWIEKRKYDELPIEEKEQFAHICPDFILEHLTKLDSIVQLKNKMNEYITNGCRLGYLIDHEARQVYVYHNGKEIIRSFSDEISGYDVLQGFVLDLTVFNK